MNPNQFGQLGLHALVRNAGLPVLVGYLGMAGVDASGVDLPTLLNMAATGDAEAVAHALGAGVSGASQEMSSDLLNQGLAVARAFLDGAGLDVLAERLPQTVQAPTSGGPMALPMPTAPSVR